ncbi:phosphoenolpyruvate synthase [Halovenus salina]|uniref:phosphoenolpyruvate synthase n=1 Tax=Halovenus salina TaxID=1510225 RepID=UPI002260FD58|nr:phosphoenolpyruvate synthase [Halovenus salina]
MAVLWLDDIGGNDLDTVGGKAASLGEMWAADLPVPPAFIVPTATYRSFIEETGIDEELFEVVDVAADDPDLGEAAEAAQELITETPMPDSIEAEILEAFDSIGADASVAVRSSATLEDLDDASFAGQQETFLNVTREQVVDRVRECWASLFTHRALYYRQEQGFNHHEVDIAVVVQRMVDADKSGVMFTSNPSTGAPEITIESAWGLGEAVVSGSVTPDNYVIDRITGELKAKTVAEKKMMLVRDEETGETVEREVPEDRRSQRVLSDEELAELQETGEMIEEYYGQPQDVEWAIYDGEVYLLQSRPITTIDESASTAAGGVSDGGTPDDGGDSGELILSGLGATPGSASGNAKVVRKLDQLDKIEEGDIIVTEMTTPDMVPAMKRAAGIVTDEGGTTSHAAIVSRELGVPAVVGTEAGTEDLDDGQLITIDGDKGTITAGAETNTDDDGEDPVEQVRPDTPVKPMTATEVKVNVSISSAAERAAATGADGVGLLRVEHMILSLGQTPEQFIEDNSKGEYIEALVDGIRTVADEFYPRPVRVRTLDAPTDEFRQLEGGEAEPVEHNPMLGYRGIRRSLDKPEAFKHELDAFRKLYELGYDNVEIMLPLVNDAEDVLRAKRLMHEVGIDTNRRTWGAMIETPAAALSVEGIAEAGVDFVSFGTNDLVQYTLAIDRNNERVADRYDAMHPAVLDLISRTIEVCREHDVDTSICGQAGSDPEMVRYLVDQGITSISANIDAVRDIQHEVKRVEQRLLLESVR